MLQTTPTGRGQPTVAVRCDASVAERSDGARGPTPCGSRSLKRISAFVRMSRSSKRRRLARSIGARRRVSAHAARNARWWAASRYARASAPYSSASNNRSATCQGRGSRRSAGTFPSRVQMMPPWARTVCSSAGEPFGSTMTHGRAARRGLDQQLQERCLAAARRADGEAVANQLATGQMHSPRRRRVPHAHLVGLVLDAAASSSTGNPARTIFTAP